jgi:hypothetical protein
MTPVSLNLPGDLILLVIVALVAAVPVLLLRGLYRRQRRALLERVVSTLEAEITKGK